MGPTRAAENRKKNTWQVYVAEDNTLPKPRDIILSICHPPTLLSPMPFIEPLSHQGRFGAVVV